MDFTASTVVTLLVIIGFLALIVSIITEVTKGVAILQKIPANLQVIVLSLLLTLVSYFAYISYSKTDIIWYYIVADIVAGFIVAYVALYGWSKLAELYKKFRNIPTLDITADTPDVVTSVISENTSKNHIENKDGNTTKKESMTKKTETQTPVASGKALEENVKTEIEANVLPVLETIITNVKSVAADAINLSTSRFEEVNTNIDTSSKTTTKKAVIDKAAANKDTTNKTSSDKASTSIDKAATNKVSTDKSPTNKAAAEKAPTNKTTTEKTSAEKTSTKKAATNKASSDKASTNKVATDKSSSEKASTNKSTTDKTSADKVSTNKPTTDKSSSEKASTNKSTTDKTSADKVSTNKPATVKSSSEKASTNKSTIDKTSSDKTSTNKASDKASSKKISKKAFTDKAPTEKASADNTSAQRAFTKNAASKENSSINTTPANTPIEPNITHSLTAGTSKEDITVTDILTTEDSSQDTLTIPPSKEDVSTIPSVLSNSSKDNSHLES